MERYRPDRPRPAYLIAPIGVPQVYLCSICDELLLGKCQVLQRLVGYVRPATDTISDNQSLDFTQ